MIAGISSQILLQKMANAGGFMEQEAECWELLRVGGDARVEVLYTSLSTFMCVRKFL